MYTWINIHLFAYLRLLYFTVLFSFYNMTPTVLFLLLLCPFDDTILLNNCYDLENKWS